MAATNQARTNLGPLTTAVSLPETCASLVEQCSTCNIAWRGQTCFASTFTDSTNYGVQDNTDCWPATTSFVANPPVPLQGWGFYSPGISCPSGMVTACSATAGGVSGWPVQFGMLKGETAVGCCPSGYSCTNNGLAQTCQLSVSQTTFEIISCQSGNIGLSSFVTLPQSFTTTSSSSISLATITQYYLYAPLIQLNWQASDRASSTSSSTSSPASSPTSSTPSNTSSPSPTNTSPSKGLSVGASAGIGVGVALVVIALIALGFFIGKKRRNLYKRTAMASPPEPQYEMNAKPDPYPSSTIPAYKPYAPEELPGHQTASELPPNTQRPAGDVYEM